jgi:hypothetical protein
MDEVVDANEMGPAPSRINSGGLRYVRGDPCNHPVSGPGADDRRPSAALNSTDSNCSLISFTFTAAPPRSGAFSPN